MGAQLESMVSAEVKRREEALRQQQQQKEQSESRLEQRWHTTVKEESAALTHLKATLVGTPRRSGELWRAISRQGSWPCSGKFDWK